VCLLKARKDDTARSSAQRFLEGVFRNFGMPSTIISDRDPKLISEFWKELMGLLGTRMAMTTANHPQADGRSERANQSVENVLRAFVDYNQADWADKLWVAEFAINGHVNDSKGFSPFFLDMGREPTVPATLWKESAAPSSRKGGQYSPQAVVDTVAASLRQVQDRLVDKQAEWVGRDVGDRGLSAPFVVGDKVFVKREVLRDATVDDAGVSKLLPRFVGPFVVEKVMGPATYKLLLPPAMKCHPVFNVDKLKRAVNNPQEFGDRGRQEPGPVAMDSAGNQLFEVERILDKKFLRGKVYFLVEWTGYSGSSWEPVAALQAPGVRKLIREFNARYQPPRSERQLRQRRNP